YGGPLWVGQDCVLAAGELGAIGSVVLRACLTGVPVFDPGVFEVAVSAGVQCFPVKMTDEGLGVEFVPARSEERRVGKECRVRGARAHQKIQGKEEKGMVIWRS